MSKILKYVMVFAMGSLTGAYAAYAYLKNDFEQRIEEATDIAESRADRVKKSAEQVNSDDNPAFTQEEIKEYEAVIQKCDYSSYSNPKKEKEEQNMDNLGTPYVISDEEFGEVEGYEVQYLTYYSDCLLADEDGDPVDDMEHLVGNDFMHQFGEYEEDAVYIRNDDIGCDFQIIKDARTLQEAREGM